MLLAIAFETDECPGDCSCHMDGLLMLVDCSGLEMSELPEFPDNHVWLDAMSHCSMNKLCFFVGSHAGFVQ